MGPVISLKEAVESFGCVRVPDFNPIPSTKATNFFTGCSQNYSRCPARPGSLENFRFWSHLGDLAWSIVAGWWLTRRPAPARCLQRGSRLVDGQEARQTPMWN